MVETEKLHIPVPFKAVPSPRITWHKDGKELKADERLSFRSEPPHCCTTVFRATDLLSYRDNTC